MSLTVSQYREGAGITQVAFAAMLGKSKSHLCAIESTNRCSAKLALLIEEKSGGAVDAASLNEEIAQARRVAA